MEKKKYSTLVDVELLKRVRMDAIIEGKKDYEIIEEALKEYFDKKDNNVEDCRTK